MTHTTHSTEQTWQPLISKNPQLDVECAEYEIFDSLIESGFSGVKGFAIEVSANIRYYTESQHEFLPGDISTTLPLYMRLYTNDSAFVCIYFALLHLQLHDEVKCGPGAKAEGVKTQLLALNLLIPRFRLVFDA